MTADYILCKHGTGYWEDQEVDCDKCRIEVLEQICKSAHRLIYEAVGTEDGMNGNDGLAMMRRLEDAVPSIEKVDPTGPVL